MSVLKSSSPFGSEGALSALLGVYEPSLLRERETDRLPALLPRLRASSWSLRLLTAGEEGRNPGLAPASTGRRGFGDNILGLCVPASESSAPDSEGVKPRTVFIAGEAMAEFCWFCFFRLLFAALAERLVTALTTCTRPRSASDSSAAAVGCCSPPRLGVSGGLRVLNGIISGSSISVTPS